MEVIVKSGQAIKTLNMSEAMIEGDVIGTVGTIYGMADGDALCAEWVPQIHIRFCKSCICDWMIITINQVCMRQDKKCENHDTPTTAATDTHRRETTRKTVSPPSACGEIA